MIKDFPGGSVVKAQPSNAGGVGLIPTWRTKVPHAIQAVAKFKKKKKRVSDQEGKNTKDAQHSVCSI